MRIVAICNSTSLDRFSNSVSFNSVSMTGDILSSMTGNDRFSIVAEFGRPRKPRLRQAYFPPSPLLMKPRTQKTLTAQSVVLSTAFLVAPSTNGTTAPRRALTPTNVHHSLVHSIRHPLAMQQVGNMTDTLLLHLGHCMHSVIMLRIIAVSKIPLSLSSKTSVDWSDWSDC